MRRRGEANPKAKLTARQVVELRTRHAKGHGVPVAHLAREYGVTATNAGLIVTGRTWRHVGGPVRPVADHRLANHGARYCPTDGYPVRYGVDRLGRTLLACAACERRRERVCMDCGRAVDGKAWRCAEHRQAASRRSEHDHTRRYRRDINRRALERLRRETPQQRAHRLAMKRAWRLANPRKVAMQKRRARLAGKPGGWKDPARYRAYQQAYRAAHRVELREKQRARYWRQRQAYQPPPTEHAA